MKVEQYRESVRTHYTELLAGTTKGLSRDLAIPLSVGQHVIACHPKTREIHDGTILSVGRSSYRVQFDRPELGVEFVMVTRPLFMCSCCIFFCICMHSEFSLQRFTYMLIL